MAGITGRSDDNLVERELQLFLPKLEITWGSFGLQDVLLAGWEGA